MSGKPGTEMSISMQQATSDKIAKGRNVFGI